MTTVQQLTPADVLLRAAAALRAGTVLWGRDQLVGTDGCRCALGVIAFAADPHDEDGDPRWVAPEVRLVAQQAMDRLADYLVTELDAPEAGDVAVTVSNEEVLVRDPFETIGAWNDAQAGPATVIGALLAAAERAA